MKSIEEILEAEREKLNSLVDEALRSGTPLSETYDIMAQCAKIKRLAGADSTVIKSEAVQRQSRKVDRIIMEMYRQD